MGYNTTFKLEWTPQKPWKGRRDCDHPLQPTDNFCPTCGKPVARAGLDAAVAQYIAASHEQGEMLYGINEDGSSSDSCKWYEHKEEMKAMSAAFPDVLFKLDGVGEEAGDIWEEEDFLNGKVQVAKAVIMIPQFDAKELR